MISINCDSWRPLRSFSINCDIIINRRISVYDALAVFCSTKRRLMDWRYERGTKNSVGGGEGSKTPLKLLDCPENRRGDAGCNAWSYKKN